MRLDQMDSEVELQAFCMLRAVRLIDWAVEDQDQVGVWFGVHAALSAAASLSKLLWGAKDQALRETLRDRLGVEDDSPLRPRHVRNSFEHIDERIDYWARTTTTVTLFGRGIGGQPEKDQFGHYDQHRKVVAFWDESVDLAEIADEASRLVKRTSGDDWAFDPLRLSRRPPDEP